MQAGQGSQQVAVTTVGIQVTLGLRSGRLSKTSQDAAFLRKACVRVNDVRGCVCVVDGEDEWRWKDDLSCESCEWVRSGQCPESAVDVDGLGIRTAEMSLEAVGAWRVYLGQKSARKIQETCSAESAESCSQNRNLLSHAPRTGEGGRGEDGMRQVKDASGEHDKLVESASAKSWPICRVPGGRPSRAPVQQQGRTDQARLDR